MARFDLAGLEENIESVIAVKSLDDNLSYLDILLINHTLRWWVVAHGIVLINELLDKRNVILFTPFWSLLQHHNIELFEHEKEILIRDLFRD